MICKNCGADLTPTAKFCRKCGTPVSETPETNIGTAVSQQSTNDEREITTRRKFCRKCGNKLLPSARFCTKCGMAVLGITDSSRISSEGIQETRNVDGNAATTAGVQAQQAPPEKLCNECGNRLLPNAKFCTKCGSSVAQVEGTDVPPLVQQESLSESLDEPRTNTVQPELISKCKRCGSELKPNAKFCTKCGAAFFKPVDASKAVQKKKKTKDTTRKVEIADEQVYGKPTDTCLRCGEKLPINSPNCPSCGAKRVNCPVCKRNINNVETVGACPFCQNQFHYAHLKETVKVTGKCPMCKSPLKQHEIEEKKQVSAVEIKS
ncbi:MAG: zinc-ribbon domain-containing protein [Candidatus Odinarchaeota archaeon]